MKRNRIVLLVLLCVFLLSACAAAPGGGMPIESKTEEASGQPSAEAYHKITAEEAKEMIDAGGVTIVDVRTPNEYAQGHVPGALLVPNEEIGGEMPDALPDQDAVLVVYCRTGVRSKQASDKLVALGYRNVYDMGGIVDWPYETESGEA